MRQARPRGIGECLTLTSTARRRSDDAGMSVAENPSRAKVLGIMRKKPIPSLDDLSISPSLKFLDGVVSLVSHVRAQGGPVAVVIRRLGEPAQFDPELLGELKATGVLPGATAIASATPRGVRLEVDGFDDALDLPAEVAVHVFVQR